MIYDKVGKEITAVFSADGVMLLQAYDCDGNPLLQEKDYRTFSVLSDSYGAISGGVTPSTNAVYYPASDVTEISQMWWALFGESYGCTLDTNNSFSGSRIANDDSWYAGIENSFIGRANNIGDPDLIFVLGGTNDVWNRIPLGEYVYSNWTESDKETFRGALSYLFYYLKNNYDADIVFLCNTLALSSSESWAEQHPYYVSAHTICDEMNVPIIDVSPVASGNHPTALGMRQIRNKIMISFGCAPTVVRDIQISLQMPATISWNPSSNTFVVDHIEENSLYKVTVNVTEIGGENTYLYFQASGSNTTKFASFEKYAGQTGTMSTIVEASQFVAGTNVNFGVCTQGGGNNTKVSSIKIEEVTF